MPSYAFDPVAVELSFGLPGSPLPGWRLELGAGRSLLLRGRIDRVDLCRDESSAEAFAVVVDYKSSPKKLDALKIGHGLQLQLLAYLSVLCQRRGDVQTWAGNPLPTELTAALRDTALRPAGVFYVALHGAASVTGGRGEILGEDEAGRRATYQHAGRFDLAQLPRLDRRPGGQASGQFRYALNRDGSLSRRGGDALPAGEFSGLLAQVEASLRQLGDAVFAGDVRVAPVRLSASERACDRCDYRAICRFDPWTQPYRTLAQPAAQEGEA
jgi:ATP-dependent helicase/nuclease subunit B